MALPKKSKRSPAEGELPCEYAGEPTEETLTAYAGIPLFVRAARSLGVPARVKRRLEVKQRQSPLHELRAGQPPRGSALSRRVQNPT